MVFVPDDVIYSLILPKLSGPSLLRFKSVSKSWSSFIFNRFNTLVLAGKSSIIVRERRSNKFPQNLIFLGKDYSKIIEAEKSFISLYNIISIVGSCNGLICVNICDGRKTSRMLWNPLTGKKKIIPKPSKPYAVNEIIDSRETQIDLGFDKVGNECKIVRMETLLIKRIGEVKSLQVFNKSKGWKLIRRFAEWAVCGDRKRGIQIGGALYWPVYNPKTTEETKTWCFHVLEFDLQSEKVVKWEGPTGPSAYDYENYVNVEIIEWNGLVSALKFNGHTQCDLWVKSEEHIWNKVKEFTNLLVSDLLFRDRVRNDRFVCEDEQTGKTFFFDLLRNEIKDFDRELPNCCDCVEYVPSFLSPS